MILDFTTAPTCSKVLPFVGLAAGLALAKYQKKDCIFCYVGYAAIGLAIGSVPIIMKAKQ